MPAIEAVVTRWPSRRVIQPGRRARAAYTWDSTLTLHCPSHTSSGASMPPAAPVTTTLRFRGSMSRDLTRPSPGADPRGGTLPHADAKANAMTAEILWRLLAGAGLGAAVGLEREIAGQPAGLRTHTTVA